MCDLLEYLLSPLTSRLHIALCTRCIPLALIAISRADSADSICNVDRNAIKGLTERP